MCRISYGKLIKMGMQSHNSSFSMSFQHFLIETTPILSMRKSTTTLVYGYERIFFRAELLFLLSHFLSCVTKSKLLLNATLALFVFFFFLFFFITFDLRNEKSLLFLCLIIYLVDFWHDYSLT